MVEALTPTHTGREDYPTMEEVAEKMNLCLEQRVCFTFCCAAVLDIVLKRLVGDIDGGVEGMSAAQREAYEEANKKVQALIADDRSGLLFQFTARSAGTGKSRVVSAVCEFARRWRVRDGIVVSATTGIAGANLSGCTWQSAMGLDAFAKGDAPLADPKDLIKRAWSSIGMLIVDEISMASPEQLQSMHERMQDLKENYKDRFGGVHVAFFGDFQQIPAIGSTLLSLPEGILFSLFSILCM
jgi:hypothetical protein